MSKHPKPTISYYKKSDYDTYLEDQKKESLNTTGRTQRHAKSFDYIHEKIKQYHPQAKTMLCIGCRDDYEINHFTELGYDVMGIDLHDSGKIIKCDMAKMYEHPVLSKKKFDVIVAVDALEHCIDLEGLVKGLQLICKMGVYVVGPIREEYSKWDCNIHGFMEHEIKKQEVDLYFPGFKTVFLHTKPSKMNFVLTKIDDTIQKMKNVLVANVLKKRERHNDKRKGRKQKELISLLKAQIDNSLNLKWKSEDIWVVTNIVDFEYRDVKVFNFPLPDCQATGSKTFAIKEILDRDLTDDVLWVHDLDAWQNAPFECPYFADIGITGYNPNKFNGGSVFYRNTKNTKELVNLMVEKLIEARKNPEDKGREEPVLNSILVPSKNKAAQGKVTMLDQTYNLGCSSFVERYNRAEKPIKVCHFHPGNRLAWDTFVRDRNRLNIKVINNKLVDLFLDYFSSKIKSFRYQGERGYDGDWRPMNCQGGFSGLDTRGKEEIRHIIYDDRYKFRQLNDQKIDYIVDVGANLGVFALLARFLHPEAKRIIAVEPVDETIQHLLRNVKGFDIAVESVALGDGDLFYYHEMADNISHIVVKDKPKQKQLKHIPSKTLPQLFEQYKIPLDSNYVLKFDCEGGEKYLLEDSKVVEIFKNCLQIMMEVHFKSPQTPYDSWLKWEKYDDWLRSNFSSTHEIDYYKSSKHRGKGHYCLVKK